MSLTLSPTRPLAVEDSNLPDLVLVILGRPVWRARGLRLRREREELGRLAFCGFGEAHEYRHHGLPTSAEIIELRVGEARQEIWSMRPPRLVMADETLALTVAQPPRDAVR